MTIFLTVVSGVVIAAALYQLLETVGLIRAFRGMPRDPAVGIAALVGSEAEVVEGFKRSGTESPAIGRVRVGSESWQAELVGDSGRLANVGDWVSVVGASGSVLKVTWR